MNTPHFCQSISPEHLWFPPVAGQTLRADCAGGALSSDFGARLFRGIDRPSGLTERLAAAIHDQRPQSYLAHPLRDLLAQRMYQIAAGYAEANDATHLRHAPRCPLGGERRPLEAQDDLARAPTCSRLAPQRDRPDLSRRTQAWVDHCIASAPAPPAALGLDIDHSDDPTPGPQALTFYNHDSQNHG